MSGQEVLLNLGIVCCVRREVNEIILRQKPFEGVRNDHHRCRNRYANVREAAHDASLVQRVADKSQAAGFASERAGTKAQKIGAAGLEHRGLEATGNFGPDGLPEIPVSPGNHQERNPAERRRRNRTGAHHDAAAQESASWRSDG